MIKSNESIFVLNISNSPLEIKKSDILVRGQVCLLDEINSDLVSTITIDIKKFKPFQMSGVISQIDTSIAESDKQKLLTLLNNYRD